ncbi:MAG: hypothetical protein HY293_11775 [Planctomycetes bacterium]|nr:hypothetical protein [Planctomycetota bacterium]
MEPRTGFEWLDTPFIITRTLATLLGAFLVCVVGWELIAAIRSSGSGTTAEQGSGHPLLGDAILVLLLLLAIPSTILVWRRPRLGFVLSAVEWIPCGWMFLDSLRDWRGAALALGPLSWLAFVAWRVGPGRTDWSAPKIPPGEPAEEECTGFEWLDTPFIITRVLVSLLGAWCLFLVVSGLCDSASIFLASLKPKDPDVVERTRCWAERTPGRDVLMGLPVTVPAILGTLFVWRRPRVGFLLAGLAWVAVFVVGILVEVLLTQLDQTLELPDWSFAALFLIPPLWLAFAAWKVPLPSISPAS